jgi:hypothetical protein
MNIYLNKVVRVRLPDMVNYLFDAFPDHCGVGRSTLDLTGFSQLFFGEDTLFSVLELVLNRDCTKSIGVVCSLTCVLFSDNLSRRLQPGYNYVGQTNARQPLLISAVGRLRDHLPIS